MKEKVKNYLKSLNVGKTPTEIGLALGVDYNSASSSVTHSLKKLIEEGLVYKAKIDGKVLYGWVRNNKINYEKKNLLGSNRPNDGKNTARKV